MKRRDFVKTGMAASAGAFFIDSLLGCTSSATLETSIDQFYEGFQDPPLTSRVFVRWWWNGNRLAEKEILRELDVMKAAGIGGVEINPIAFPEGSDPAGYEPLIIFEDKWLDMLQVALQGAKERGMICDMIVGSGWPFGGEILEKEEQSQIVTIETIDLQGGKKFQYTTDELLARVDPEIHARNEKHYKEIIMARLLPKVAEEFMEGMDLMGNIANETLTIDVPKGEHVLYYVVKLTGLTAVINGSPGAAGPVLNHYSKPAVERYLNWISDNISGKIGHMGNHIRAMFCDSMELEGANWNADMLDEFEKRRGYALRPYLPFVLKKTGHMGNPIEGEYGTKFPDEIAERIRRVDLDYYKTRIELFKERFIDTFNEWCHRNGMKSRMQAYGRGMHPLEASMEIDFPDSETWLFSDVGREYPDTGLQGRAHRMCNKAVASAAALTGKKVVSCEEVTNVETTFMSTLENIKIVGDQSNISGVTHSFLHGFNYSPPEAAFPGWVRYGTFFSERNTWWPWFRRWSDYKARISYLLQHATLKANVAILPPLTDLWLKLGPQRDPFPEKWYPDYIHNLWEAIHQNGGGCDYVSEKIINNATFEGGRMIYNSRSYDTLLLPATETLDRNTLESLYQFAKAGGSIVFIGQKPFKSPSYEEMKENDSQIKELVDKLFADYTDRVSEYPAPVGNLLQWYGKLQDELGIKSNVTFDRPSKYLNQASYRLGNNDMFFLSNHSLNEDVVLKAEFYVDQKLQPWMWNLETGERMRYPVSGANNMLDINLPHAASLLIVFEEETEGELYHPLPMVSGGTELKGTWQLKLDHINGETLEIELDGLKDFIEDEATRNFAGTATYQNTFTVDNKDVSHIDLGRVPGITELSLNGKSLGTRWYGHHTYDISEAMKIGENRLSIKLTTIIGNYMKGLDENVTAQRWTVNQSYHSMGIIGPVRIF
ncbi:MAG: glycosyl hydrolase [Bacteroidota bacterium]